GTTYSYSETCAIGTASAYTSAPAVAAKVSGHRDSRTGSSRENLASSVPKQGRRPLSCCFFGGHRKGLRALAGELSKTGHRIVVWQVADNYTLNGVFAEFYWAFTYGTALSRQNCEKPTK